MKTNKNNIYTDNKDGSTTLTIISKKFGSYDFIIDTEDMTRVKPYKWYLKYNGENLVYAKAVIGYRSGGGSEYSIALHRFLTSFKWSMVDHENRNTLDNRKCNLRETNRRLNKLNSRKPKNGKNKYRGVYNTKNRKKFIVQIRSNGKMSNFGTFECETEAAMHYNKKALELFGDYAMLNKIEE